MSDAEEPKKFQTETGAGGGNRTLVSSLENCRSTIELRPRPTRRKSYCQRLPCQPPHAMLALMNSLLLTGGVVVDPANHFDSPADVLIIDGKISAVGKKLFAPEGI